MSPLVIVAIIIMVFCTLRGLRRGFVMLVYGIAAWIFVLLFVFFAKTPIYNMYKENERIYGQLYDNAYVYVNRYVPESVYDETKMSDALDKLTAFLPKDTKLSSGVLSGLDEEKLKEYGVEVPEEYAGVLDDAIDRAAEGGGTVGDLTEELKSKSEEGVASIREGIVADITDQVVGYLLEALAVLTAYIIAKLICTIVKIILITVFEAKPIRGMTHLLGGMLGFGEGILYLWIILYIISLISVTKIGQSLAADVAANSFLFALDQNNLIAGILGGIYHL